MIDRCYPLWGFSDSATGYRSGTWSTVGPCSDARTSYEAKVMAAFKDDQTKSLQYMDDMIGGWKDALAAATPVPQPGQIKIASATYGGNCGVAEGNATAHIRAYCDATTNCTYAVNTRDLGDPAYGCGKEYRVDYTCVGVPGTKTVTLAKEADGKGVQLSCK